jgi:hypothetical protein
MQQDFYCGEACEERRSGRHNFACSKCPLDSADLLYQSFLDDHLPEDDEVFADFGLLISHHLLICVSFWGFTEAYG